MPKPQPIHLLLFGLLLSTTIGVPCVTAGNSRALAEQLRQLDAQVIVLGTVRRPPLEGMLAREIAGRLHRANQADRAAWNQVKTLADWERYREPRLQALRQSLGTFPPVPDKVRVRVTGTQEGDGYRVDNLVYESRPGLLVTANLYRPAKPAPAMPGIIICHSHQQPRHIGIRQDMAMTWARAGCLVLVPDHLGQGERKQHPFGTASDSHPHDYHFRYDLGIQLQVLGDSLMGWLVWDLQRGVDVLLAQPGIDAKRLLLISEPAGGGDVAAVTAALDTRISGVLVNNFGGPQPETPYPLPPDAEEAFNYTGSGSWESTRNLRLSARDGFLPWTIVASLAPRRLLYYHEFYWDRAQDPVWKRLQKVYGFQNAGESLVGLAGRGFVVGSAPENTHWLAISREICYPTLQRWYGIPYPKKEYSQRRPPEELLSLTPAVKQELGGLPFHNLISQLGSERSREARAQRARLPLAQRREQLRQAWAALLGDCTPQGQPVQQDRPAVKQRLGSFTVERIHLATEPGIVVPVLLLTPQRRKGEARLPLVLGVAQEGKQEFLRRRADTIAELLMAGVAVALPDLRGTGETSPGPERDRRSAATGLSATELMLGQTLLGGRLRDLRAVLRHLRQRADLDGQRVALWGDSFAASNPDNLDLQVSYTASKRPAQAEPLGGLLTLLGALFEPDIRTVYARGGLCDYQSLLGDPFIYLPHDAIVPGVLQTGDLCDVVAALVPRPIWLEGLVDGHNRPVPTKVLASRYEPARRSYQEKQAQERLRLGVPVENATTLARWFADTLRDR